MKTEQVRECHAPLDPWLPIESTPKDEIVWATCDDSDSAYKQRLDSRWNCWRPAHRDGGYHSNPTHWMPAPPEARSLGQVLYEDSARFSGRDPDTWDELTNAQKADYEASAQAVIAAYKVQELARKYQDLTL